MKYSVLDAIACPECGGQLQVEVFEEINISGSRDAMAAGPCTEYCGRNGIRPQQAPDVEANCEACRSHEILSGVLKCACGMWYPVIRGVPRLLPKELESSSMFYYPGFFEKYEGVLPALQREQKAEVEKGLEVKGKEDTIYRFTYEWNEFKDYDDDNFSIGIGPIGDDFFQGKRVLDAGCGAGRHSRAARRHGAREVYAMDLSNAVDAAFENTVSDGSINVVQGDIFHPPFKRGAFDLIYSLWALPHTHNPPQGFHALVPCLNSSGSIVVYLYNSQRWLSYKILGLMRKITLKLPNPAVRLIALALGTIDYGLLIKPYALLSKFAPVKAVLDKVTPSHIRLYSTRSFKTCHTDWMDRLFYPYVHYYSRVDADLWLRREKFAEKSILTLGSHGLIVRGTGLA
ncbi:MAG: methyltransferase domain-containing protein [Desulfobacteraceae bacterium]|nr:methyltransferase domain-containing protein [Desulfobacteraceae bacterium]